MAEWRRTTEDADPAHLPADVRAAVEAYAEREGLQAPLAGVTAAVRTVSSKRRGGGRLRRRPPVEQRTWMLLTDTHLVFVSEASARPACLVYRLDGIEVRPFASPLVQDTGLDVTGHAVGATGDRSTLFLPLDEGPAGRAFRDALTRAVARARA